MKKVFETPRGFQKILWQDVVAGQEVYTVGTKNRKPWAWGSFTVINPKLRTLRSKNTNRLFPEPLERLLVKIN
jgi:hypothetical protein